MAKITKLIAEQKAKFPAYVEEWTRIGLSTERAGRPRAEAGVKLAYEAAGLRSPSLVIWVDSPLGGAIAYALLTGTTKAGKSVAASVRDSVWASVRDSVGDSVWDSVRDSVAASVRDSVGDSVRDSVWASVAASVRDSVWDSVRDSVAASVRDSVWASVAASVRDSVYKAAYGQHDANWLAFYDFFERELSLEAPAKLSGMTEIAKSSGWWWPFENAVILSERPTELHRNAEGRLHREDGPALLYPDGYGIWALNGLDVGQQIIEAPETLTFEQVRDQPNTEIRRHMLDRFGGLRGSAAAGAWLKGGNLEPISSTDITAKMQPSGLSIWRLSNGDAPVLCRLYRAELPDDEPLVILTVVCTSTAKETFLRVPPNVTDAAKARNWTFGMSLAEAVET